MGDFCSAGHGVKMFIASTTDLAGCPIFATAYVWRPQQRDHLG